jgi:hypothetical protein
MHAEYWKALDVIAAGDGSLALAELVVGADEPHAAASSVELAIATAASVGRDRVILVIASPLALGLASCTKRPVPARSQTL